MAVQHKCADERQGGLRVSDAGDDVLETQARVGEFKTEGFRSFTDCSEPFAVPSCPIPKQVSSVRYGTTVNVRSFPSPPS